MSHIKDDKFITELGKIIANSDITTSEKKIAKAQYDKSYNAVILGVNTDFTDDVTEEEQEALINKYSLKEVPDKDNYYTFKINGNYYVKSSNTDFKLYEKVVIRVPNGSWDNMYIEVQKDTEWGGATWFTSAEEPTKGIKEGDYWVKIDDEERRNIIEVRKYVDGNWGTVDYYDNIVIPNYTFSGEKCDNIESIFNVGNIPFEISERYKNNIILGSNNSFINLLEYRTALDYSFIEYERVESSHTEGYQIVNIKISSDGVSFLKSWFSLDQLFYIVIIDANNKRTRIGYSTSSPPWHRITLPCILNQDINEDGEIIFYNIKTIYNDDDSYESKGLKVCPAYLYLPKDEAPTTNASHDQIYASQTASCVIGDSNSVASNNLIIGDSNDSQATGSVIIGNGNVGKRWIGAYERSIMSVYTGERETGEVLNDSHPIEQAEKEIALYGHTNDYLYLPSTYIFGNANSGCRIAFGNHNTNVYCAVGENNMNMVYNDDEVGRKLYCEQPYMFGRGLCTYHTPVNDKGSYTPIGYYYGQYNDQTSGVTNTSLYNQPKIEIFGWGGRSSEGEIVRHNIRTMDTIGNMWVDGRYDVDGADYSEYYEWKDVNTDDIDVRGLFVTLEGTKIRLANNNDTYVLGAVSATPSVLGNAMESEWKGKYKRDIFGAKLRDDKGNLILSEDYNPEEQYIPRSARSEYSPVGTHGQLIVIDDGTCEVNGYCGVGENGIGRRCDDMEKVYRGLAFRVTERLDDTHIRIVIK